MKTITIKNLKKTCSETRSNNGIGITSIYVDITDGELITRWHHDSSSWTEFDSKDIILVCSTRKAMTMAEIKAAAEEAIAQEMNWREARRA